MWTLTHLTHLCGPQLQQQSSRLCLAVNSFLPQELSVGLKPRGRAQVFGETCGNQKFPESFSNTLSCLLLICRTEKRKTNKVKCWVTGKKRKNSNINIKLLYTRGGALPSFQVGQVWLEEECDPVVFGNFSWGAENVTTITTIHRRKKRPGELPVDAISTDWLQRGYKTHGSEIQHGNQMMLWIASGRITWQV